MPNKRLKYRKLCIDTDLSKLKEIRDYIFSASNRFGFSDDTAQQIALAVDEACTNLIKYSFDYKPDNKICISIESDKKEFSVVISDLGTPFNPCNVSIPDMKEYFKNMKPGGLGILIMRSVMDDISYFPSDSSNPFNILKLKKFLA